MKKKFAYAETLSLEESRKTLGENLSFAAAEAYKLLRTNLGFSLSDNSGCKVIGVTSAMKGEGKSTTSINMAYTMAQNGPPIMYRLEQLLQTSQLLPCAVTISTVLIVGAMVCFVRYRLRETNRKKD